MHTIEIEQVTKSFGSTLAVNDLSLAVPKGSVYGFIGPNGSGKTTTLRMIMNILYPDSGTIRVLGEEQHDSCSDNIGYMPEERGVYTRMKVKDVIHFYGSLKNSNYNKKDVLHWLQRLDLGDWGDKKVETLSKGMRQKIQFIATIVSRPEIIILDEPFSGLDPVNMEVIKDVILELQKDGTTVIFSTHDMNVAERMCDFIFMIFKGKKVLDGTLENIQDEYGSDTIRVKIDDGISILKDLNGVDKVTDYGQVQELRMVKDCDHQSVLSQLMDRTRVSHFEIIKPTLHDIFLRIAGPEAEEVNHA